VATDGYRLLRDTTRRLLWSLTLLLAVFSCEREHDDPTGGETHFLVRCEPGSNSCGTELTCLCGVCTRPCSERATCETLPAAACVASSGVDSCGNAEAPGHCDVACLIDADCSVLSQRHHCQLGACRAESLERPSSGDAGTGGATSVDDAGACVRGAVSANQVLVIGDSFFAASHQITAYLEGLARDAGVVPTGARYRDNSRLNANMLANAGIADQYASATAEADVKVVIMNGGGADVLVGSCDTVDASCPPIDAAAAAARELLAKMASDGVANVVYVFYPDPMKDTTPNLRAKMDVLRPLIQGACEDSAVPCHFLDLRRTFADHYPDYIQADGLNPTATGSQAAALAIWAVMQSECIAQ
jgi:hypothetical protein